MIPWPLSEREQEVLSALCKHGAAKLIARELGISHRTVELHISRIKEKMRTPHMTLAALKWDRYVFARTAKHETAE